MSTELEEICSLHQRFVQLKLPDHHTHYHILMKLLFFKNKDKQGHTV